MNLLAARVPRGSKSPRVLPLVSGRGRLSTEEAGSAPRRSVKDLSRPTMEPALRFLNGPMLERASPLSLRRGAVRGSGEPAMEETCAPSAAVAEDWILESVGGT